MKQGSFEEKVFIKADAQTVLSMIADYNQHHKIHPLIIDVEAGASPNPGVKRYLITDQLRWGPFTFKIRYQADIISVTEDTVHTEAHQSPNTHVTNITKVTPKDDGVLLHETITLKAPNFLFGYAFKQAQAAHKEMLERIKAYAEAQPKI
ncbi:MAG: hypothetical protein Kow002_04470 [Anaerolineales bacterium]